jgi:hypothetical protein
LSKFYNHKNFNCKVTLDNKEEYNVYSSWLANEGLADFQGWKCNVGSERLFIDEKLEVYSGECKNDYLGTVNTFELKENSICKVKLCKCTDDLSVAKSKD